MARRDFATGNSRFLDTLGDGTGSIEMAVDGSVTPVDFCLIPPSNQQFILRELHTSIIDTGGFDTGGYGNNGNSPLTNGVVFIVQRAGGPLFEFPQQGAFKRNIDWTINGQTSNYISYGQGPDILTSRFEFTPVGSPLVLNAGDCFGYRIRDDITHLDEHRVYARWDTYRL